MQNFHMLLRDYFAGQSIQLNSPVKPAEVAERINRSAGSFLWPFSFGAVGGVWFGHLRLRYRSSLFEYNAKPVLSGRLIESQDGSNFELRYRAPIWVYVFYLFWYLMLTAFAVTQISNVWDANVKAADIALDAAILTGLVLAPIGLHAVGTRDSDEDLACLLNFLSVQAEARR